ncbi:hypothetical protein MFLAVUS_010807 [Mucor flavus]|uniref:Ankyrin n=1 Tax=Mucor flavus TaxID=439312 RepID=A0ABP9ZDR3_9FUNG
MKAPTTQDNLWVAAGDGQLDRVKELVETGVDVNSQDQFGYTAMHAAVSYSQIDIVKYLLEKGANVNIEDFEKDTPLYVAETVEMAQLLLDHGAEPKRVNEEGLSPAATALEEGWEDVAKLLADITKEVLPTKEEEEENDESEALSHVQEEDEEEPELSDELSNQMQEIMKRIEEQGGVENEEELRDMVTKMVVDGMRRNLEQNQ